MEQEKDRVLSMKSIALVLGVLGGIIALLSAVAAFVAVGGEAAYSARLWTGWAALLLALLATAAALFLTTRPRRASLIMLISGMVGFICINLFYINTFYGLAIPLWIAGAGVAFISTRTTLSKATREEK